MRFRRCRITVPRWVAELALRVGPVTDHRLGFRRQLPVGPRLPKSGAAASRGAVFGTTNSGANRSRRKQVTLSGPIEVSGRSKRVWFFWGALFFSIVSYSVDGLKGFCQESKPPQLGKLSHFTCPLLGLCRRKSANKSAAVWANPAAAPPDQEGSGCEGFLRPAAQCTCRRSCGRHPKAFTVADDLFVHPGCRLVEVKRRSSSTRDIRNEKPYHRWRGFLCFRLGDLLCPD
jgi:hypothetical protein